MILTLIIFLCVLSVLVLVHEAGHFFVARRFGVTVEEFGLGLPPRIFGLAKKADGRWRFFGRSVEGATSTVYSLNWIPLGGFVKIKGEDGEVTGEPDGFTSQSIVKRIAILSAGVSMNIVLAAVLLSVGFMIGSPQFLADDQAVSASAQVHDIQIIIADVVADSPAQAAGIKAGDVIVSLDDQSFVTITALQNYIVSKAAVPITVMVRRGQTTVTQEVTPQLLHDPAEPERVGLGVALARTGIVEYPWYSALLEGIKQTGLLIAGVVYGFWILIVQLVTTGRTVGDVYGPVGIAGLVGDAARLGWIYVIQFTATLSVIIAVVNFLPIPALDGGRVFFLIIEALRGKPMNQRREALMHNIGFAALMGLILLVTIRDIGRLVGPVAGWWVNVSRFITGG